MLMKNYRPHKLKKGKNIRDIQRTKTPKVSSAKKKLAKKKIIIHGNISVRIQYKMPNNLVKPLLHPLQTHCPRKPPKFECNQCPF